MPRKVSCPRQRRAHRKSRKGCDECKTRHMRCDENRPRCANCVLADRICSFTKSEPSSNAPSQRPPTIEILQLDTQDPGNTTHFTIAHMALLHHAEVHMEEYLILSCSARPLIEIAINNAIVAPYLLNQLLALSALHLASSNPTTERIYDRYATQLQSHALELFSKVENEDSDDKTVPRFLFASFLGTHLLRDTLHRHWINLSDFIEPFVHYVHIHRGLRAVISNRFWDSILHSDLKPLLQLPKFGEGAENQAPGPESFELREYFKSHASDPSIKGCESALKVMQWVLDEIRQHPGRSDLSAHATMAWPLLVSVEYVEALQQCRPEALVVLAYYAAAIHRFRQYWVFGNAGSALINLIKSNIEPLWHAYLVWPVEMLSEDI